MGDDAPEDYIVHGPNRITALPMEVPVCYQEVAHCLEKSISKIETAVLSALENTPPELYADIVHNGIYLAGGGALLRGLDKRLTDKINIPFHIAEDPLHRNNVVMCQYANVPITMRYYSAPIGTLAY